jgi:hypothetical protein
MQIVWHPVTDFYTFTRDYKCRHRKDPPYTWIRLSCVYKISINDTVVHVGRSDTCKKHGGAEKVRKAIVNLLNLNQYNTSVPITKYWSEIRLRYRPNSSNIKIGIIKTNAINKTYLQETI